MRETWREPILNIVGIHLIVLYGVAIGFMCRYLVAPFLP